VLLAGYRSRNIAKLGREKRFAYFHAIDSAGHPTRVHPDKLAASVIVPYFKGNSGWKWSGWHARATKCCLVSRQTLIDKYLGDESLLGSDTQFYYVVELERPALLGRSKLKKVGEILPRPAYPKICNWTDLCAK
jgi:hypothetical protein